MVIYLTCAFSSLNSGYADPCVLIMLDFVGGFCFRVNGVRFIFFNIVMLGFQITLRLKAVITLESWVVENVLRATA